MYYVMNQSYIEHHGIRGQRWGKRNGPPYPLSGGDYSQSEVKAIRKNRKLGNRIYNKEHFDEVLSKDKTTLSTLSYDKDRIKNAEMFYATHNFFDKQQYKALFNKKIPKTITDKNGKEIGTGMCYKYQIDTKLNKDVKVASEDSGGQIFADLYKKDRDFYNFVTDKDRLSTYFNDAVHYKFKGYREAEKTLDKITNKDYTPSTNELKELYRLFNYIIPYDGAGNANKGSDMATQRAKFFNEAKKDGYGALLDTNDAIYGGFKAKSPVIMFDMDAIVPSNIRQTNIGDKAIANLVLAYRKALRI